MPTDQQSKDAIRELAAAAANAVRTDQGVADRVRECLLYIGHFPEHALPTLLPVAIARLATALHEVLETVFPEVIRHADGEYFAGIRRFLLEPEETYSLRQLAAIWRVSVDEVIDVFHDEYDTWKEANPELHESSFRVAWANAVGATTSFNLFRPFDVDLALGDKFECARSARWRAVPVLLRLPRFITDSLTSDFTAGTRCTLAAQIENFILEMYQEEYKRAIWEEVRVPEDAPKNTPTSSPKPTA